MAIKRVAKRGFLNPVHSMDNGSFKWYLEIDTSADYSGSDFLEISGGFIFSDCRKSIELSLYGCKNSKSNQKNFKDSVKKLRTLADQINLCADTMEDFWNNEK